MAAVRLGWDIYNFFEAPFRELSPATVTAYFNCIKVIALY
jgi:hypothetical protein